ncbi:MAG: hypothetical protein WCV88_01840 [Patescibacteria group bacterium]
MFIFQSSFGKLSGSNYSEVLAQAWLYYLPIKRKTKRRPYVRSCFFQKDKIFLDRFWSHLMEKSWSDRTRRLKFFACGLDLLQHSHAAPSSKDNPNKHQEILHRFSGITRDGELFFVQVRENTVTSQKSLISIFPGD